MGHSELLEQWLLMLYTLPEITTMSNKPFEEELSIIGCNVSTIKIQMLGFTGVHHTIGLSLIPDYVCMLYRTKPMAHASPLQNP